jgi:hypothetical protein
MKKFIKTAGLAVAFAAMAVSSASATAGPAMLTSASPLGTGHNTAAVAGSTGVNLPPHTFTAGGARVSCPDADFRVTSVTTNTASVDASYSGGCTFIVGGLTLGAAAVDVNCGWTLSFHNATFTDTTGAGTGGTVVLPCSTTVTVPAIGCVIHVLAQTREGISSQNVDAAGVNSAAPTPWGSKVIANVTGLTYTTNGACAGLAEHNNDSVYAGSVYVKNVWGML